MQNYVEKIELSYKPINISFEEITLLSEDEYIKNEKLISLWNDGWWLRSPGFYDGLVTFVDGVSGVVLVTGSIAIEEFGVRPALRIRNCYDLIPGDKIRISGYIFTVLNENLALCDTCIGKSIFDNESDDFYTSHIRKYLYNWAEENGIKVKSIDR